MKRSRFSEEQIIGMLKANPVLTALNIAGMFGNLDDEERCSFAHGLAGLLRKPAGRDPSSSRLKRLDLSSHLPGDSFRGGLRSSDLKIVQDATAYRSDFELIATGTFEKYC